MREGNQEIEVEEENIKQSPKTFSDPHIGLRLRKGMKTIHRKVILETFNVLNL